MKIFDNNNNFILTICFLFLSFLMTASPNPQIAYVQKYGILSVREMQISGIPASIKMAQAMVESSAGTSTLAKEAHNHFGIKCRNDWQGAALEFIDDEKDEGANPVFSCFRVYDSPEESYIDHTKFLTSNLRYRALFSLERTDYIGWAIGLQRCGYAADSAYAEKLINTIEKYELYKYDEMEAVPDLDQIVYDTNANSGLQNSIQNTKTKEIILAAPKSIRLPNGYQRGDGYNNNAKPEARKEEKEKFETRGGKNTIIIKGSSGIINPTEMLIRNRGRDVKKAFH